jgi:putative acetyltransferase
MTMNIEIRGEHPADPAAIRGVHDEAFGRPEEGALVDALRNNGAVQLSLVASIGGRVVGHVLFSPASVGEVVGSGLGPMAVLPEHQRRGVGSALVTAGLQKLRAAGCPFVVVLGHPSFYPRFGFEPARSHGIVCEWDVPDAAFMLLVLDEPAMRDVSGLVRYRHEFSTVS